LLGEYSDSGFREPKDRFLYSLRSNGRYQLTVLSVGLVGAIYFFLSEGFHFRSLKGLVMALAYAWGLILAIYLMGHGMVSIPRRLFHDANVSRRLRRLQSHAPKIYEKLMDATEELQQYDAQVAQLKARKHGTSRDFKEWIEDLADLVAGTRETRVTAATASLPTARQNVPNVITDRYLAELTRKLKRARHKKVRYVSEWEHLIQQASRTQTILDSNSSHKLEFGKAPAYAPFYERFTILNPFMRYVLHTKIVPATYYVGSVLLALASLCIIWSELVHLASPKLSLVALTTIHHPNSSKGEIGFAGQCLAAAWLCYMCACALWSITEVKVWGNRALVRRGTYEESACWYAGQVAKLTVPLSFNFITMMPKDIHRSTVFYNFLGQLIDLTPLGKGFSSFFPILVLLPVLANIFGLYSRVRGMFGLSDLIDEEEEIGGWREGRNLIEREIRGQAGSVGLLARAEGSSGFNSPRGGSLDIERPSARSAIPSSLASTERASMSPTPSRQPRQAAPALDEEEEGNFFTDFAHRVKNTFESADTPNWFAEGFKRPKWLGGEEESGGSAAGGNNDNGISRFFGRPPEGRLRL
jgi:hypothetical protein